MRLSSNNELMKQVMNDVYGKYTENWKPKKYKDNKSRYLISSLISSFKLLKPIKGTYGQMPLGYAISSLCTMKQTMKRITYLV